MCNVVLTLGISVLVYQGVVVAATVGTEFAVSVEEYQVFPAGEDNAILAFGWLRDGFGLTDASTTCTFSSVFPISGHLSLHGGTLTLTSDLVLQNQTTFASAGYLKGMGHMFSLAESVTTIPASHPVILEDVALYLHHDLKITNTVTIRGACSIYGADNNIILSDGGNIVIDSDASLLLSSVEFHGLKDHNLRCIDNSGQLALDHTRMVQTGNFSFVNGSILFKDNTAFVGPFTFHYESILTSTIDVDSVFHLADLSHFRLGRQNGREPLYFEDQTSMIRIENATLNVINDGLTLTRGTFLGSREVVVDIESTNTANGLSFGNGIAADDLYLKMLPGSYFKLDSGHLVYDVVEVSNFFNEQTNVIFERAQNTTFHIKQDVVFKNINSVVTETPVFSLIDPGVILLYDNARFEFPLTSYSMTGTKSLLGIQDIIDSGGFIQVHSGAYPFALSVIGKNNELLGIGSIAGPITLADQDTSLTMFFDGPILQDITLNDGLIIANRKIDLGNDVIFKGAGKINLQQEELQLGPKDLNYTGSISWTGDQAVINVHSTIDLSSEWTFTGECTLNLNWNNFNFKPTGKVVVGSNSELRVNSGYMTNLDSTHFYCVDDSSKIIFDNVYAALDDHFTFSVGSMAIKNVVSLLGTYSFVYSSANTSTIASNATLVIGDGITFVAGRTKVEDGREPLYFEDRTSNIMFDDSTFIVTSSGMRLTRGQAVVNKYLMVDISSTSSADGIIFGDLTVENDFIIKINPGATWQLPNGHIGYENVTPLGIQSATNLASIVTGPQTVLYLASDVLLKNLTVIITNGIAAQFDTLVDFAYENCTFVAPGIQFNMTSKRFNAFTNLLENNHAVYVETGDFPLLTLVTGSNNLIQGFGGVAQLITLASPLSELSIGIDGIMLNRINLNNSTLHVTKRLIFGDNDGFSGSGVVDLNSNTVELGGLNLTETSSIDFVSNEGAIELRSNLYLTSRWTLSGDCTINGNGNSIVFGPTAQLVIHPNSTVLVKNVKLDALRDGQFFCLADSSKLVFDTALLSLDSDMSFTLGSFSIVNKCDIEGSDASFSYESRETSTITSRSYLKMKADTIFSYAPQSDRRDLLVFENDTAKLKLVNATLHSTETGMQLTKGFLEVRGQCNFSSDAFYENEGIILGDGTVEANDLKLDIYPESIIELTSGFIVHRNIV